MDQHVQKDSRVDFKSVDLIKYEPLTFNSSEGLYNVKTAFDDVEVDNVLQINHTNLANNTTNILTLTENGDLKLPIQRVTQQTSNISDVRLDARAGVVTTFATVVAGQASASFTIYNRYVTTTSHILVSVSLYSGDLSDELLGVAVTNRSNGLFTVTIMNSHNLVGTAAVSWDVSFLVLGNY